MTTILAFTNYGQQKGTYKFGRETGQTLGGIVGQTVIRRAKLTHSYIYLEFTEDAPIVAKGKAVLVGVTDQRLAQLEDEWGCCDFSTHGIHLYRNKIWWNIPNKHTGYTVASEDDYDVAKIRRAFKPYDMFDVESALNITPEPQIIGQTEQDETVIRMANLIRGRFSQAQVQRLVSLLASP